MMTIIEEEEESLYEDGGVWGRGRLLGKGGFGSVHLAFITSSLPRYKHIPPIVAVKSTDYSRSNSLVSEKAIYDALGHSPFLIRCFGDDATASSSGHFYYNLFLEYASGGSLWDFIENSDGLGLLESDARKLTRSILVGIHHIHRSGYAHCDIKPDNVLLVKEGESGYVGKIGDFGLTKHEDLSMGVRGTPMYLPPECSKQRIQGKPSDIWALGCVVFSMLTGTLGWDVEPDIFELLTHRYKTGVEISNEAVDFVWKCLSVDPAERPTAAMLLTHPFVKMGYSDDESEYSSGEETEAEAEEDNIQHYYQFRSQEEHHNLEYCYQFRSQEEEEEEDIIQKHCYQFRSQEDHRNHLLKEQEENICHDFNRLAFVS